MDTIDFNELARRKAYNISKGFINSEESIEKARTGVYSDNAENRKLNRVGKQYGTKAKEEESASKTPAKQDDEGGAASKPEKTLDDHAKEVSTENLRKVIASDKADEKMKAAAKRELTARGEGHEEEKKEDAKQSPSKKTDSGEKNTKAEKKESSVDKIIQEKFINKYAEILPDYDWEKDDKRLIFDFFYKNKNVVTSLAQELMKKEVDDYKRDNNDNIRHAASEVFFNNYPTFHKYVVEMMENSDTSEAGKDTGKVENKKDSAVGKFVDKYSKILPDYDWEEDDKDLIFDFLSKNKTVRFELAKELFGKELDEYASDNNVSLKEAAEEVFWDNFQDFKIHISKMMGKPDEKPKMNTEKPKLYEDDEDYSEKFINDKINVDNVDGKSFFASYYNIFEYGDASTLDQVNSYIEKMGHGLDDKHQIEDFDKLPEIEKKKLGILMKKAVKKNIKK